MPRNPEHSLDEFSESLRLAKILFDVTEQHLLLSRPNSSEVSTEEYFKRAIGIAGLEREDLDKLWHLMLEAQRAISASIDDLIFKGL